MSQHPVLFMIDFVIDDDAGVAGALRHHLGRRFGEDLSVIGTSPAAAGRGRMFANGHRLGYGSLLADVGGLRLRGQAGHTATFV